jgi:hypothetical protein
MMVNASTIVTVDLIDEITVIVGPILAMIIGIDMIIATMTDVTTTVVMTDVTTTIAMTTTTGVTTTDVIVAMIVATPNVITDTATMTLIMKTATGKGGPLRHCLKGANLTVHSRRLTVRSTSSSEVTKRSKATDRPDQTPGRSGKSTPKTRDLCGGLNSQSLSPGKIIGSTSLTLGLTRWSSTP